MSIECDPQLHPDDVQSDIEDEESIFGPSEGDQDSDHEDSVQEAALDEELRELRKQLKEKRNGKGFRMKKKREEMKALKRLLKSLDDDDQRTERKTINEDRSAAGNVGFQDNAAGRRQKAKKMMEILNKGMKPQDKASRKTSAKIKSGINALLDDEAVTSLRSKARDYQLDSLKNGDDPYWATLSSTRKMFKEKEKEIEGECKGNIAKEAALKAIYNIAILATGINEAETHGIISPEDAEVLLDESMSVFEVVTGFVWELFERTVEDPKFWGGVVLSLFGLLITGIGGLIAGGRISHHAAELCKKGFKEK